MHLGPKAKHLDLQSHTLFWPYISTLSFSRWISIRKVFPLKWTLFMRVCLYLSVLFLPWRKISPVHKYCRIQTAPWFLFSTTPTGSLLSWTSGNWFHPPWLCKPPAVPFDKQMSFKRIPKRICTGNAKHLVSTRWRDLWSLQGKWLKKI